MFDFLDKSITSLEKNGVLIPFENFTHLNGITPEFLSLLDLIEYINWDYSYRNDDRKNSIVFLSIVLKKDLLKTHKDLINIVKLVSKVIPQNTFIEINYNGKKKYFVFDQILNTDLTESNTNWVPFSTPWIFEENNTNFINQYYEKVNKVLSSSLLEPEEIYKFIIGFTNKSNLIRHMNCHELYDVLKLDYPEEKCKEIFNFCFGLHYKNNQTEHYEKRIDINSLFNGLSNMDSFNEEYWTKILMATDSNLAGTQRHFYGVNNGWINRQNYQSNLRDYPEKYEDNLYIKGKKLCDIGVNEWKKEKKVENLEEGIFIIRKLVNAGVYKEDSLKYIASYLTVFGEPEGRYAVASFAKSKGIDGWTDDVINKFNNDSNKVLDNLNYWLFEYNFKNYEEKKLKVAEASIERYKINQDELASLHKDIDEIVYKIVYKKEIEDKLDNKICLLEEQMSNMSNIEEKEKLRDEKENYEAEKKYYEEELKKELERKSIIYIYSQGLLKEKLSSSDFDNHKLITIFDHYLEILNKNKRYNPVIDNGILLSFLEIKHIKVLEDKIEKYKINQDELQILYNEIDKLVKKLTHKNEFIEEIERKIQFLEAQMEKITTIEEYDKLLEEMNNYENEKMNFEVNLKKELERKSIIYYYSQGLLKDKLISSGFDNHKYRDILEHYLAILDETKSYASIIDDGILSTFMKKISG